jgi:hypothetical protein
MKWTFGAALAALERRMIVRFAALVLLAGVAQLSLAADPAKTENYFGYLDTKCTDKQCSGFREKLRSIGTRCTEIEKDNSCGPVAEILARIFHPYVPKLAKFVAYFDQCQETDKAGKCKTDKAPVQRHGPVLLWDGKNTAHIYGARQVYAIVFADQKACLEGRVTINYKSEPNPIPVLFAAIGTKVEGAGGGDAKASESKPFKFTWFPLSGTESNQTSMWVAIAGVPIEENTVNWITLLFANKKPSTPAASAGAGAGKRAAKDGDKKDGDKSDGSEQLAGCDLEDAQAATRVLTVDGKETETAQGFAATSGFFSNSPAGRATVGIAIGQTRNVKDTTLSSGGSNAYYNAYLTVKWYVIRPRLRPIAHSDCWTPQWIAPSDTRCPSLGVFFGTNVAKDSVFQQVVYGVSLGHIWDNVGLVLGKNSIAGGDISGGGKQEGRTQRTFIGIDYSF